LEAQTQSSSLGSHFDDVVTSIYTDIFQKFFTDIWPLADIPKYICRYFIKVFWLKLVWIAYSHGRPQKWGRSLSTFLCMILMM